MKIMVVFYERGVSRINFSSAGCKDDFFNSQPLTYP
jgi:hypothetical protein